jgi:hypothetical protein
VTIGPAAREGEHVFGVAHIFASFNDTFVVRSRRGHIQRCLHFFSQRNSIDFW